MCALYCIDYSSSTHDCFFSKFCKLPFKLLYAADLVFKSASICPTCFEIISAIFLSDCLIGYLAISHWNRVMYEGRSAKRGHLKKIDQESVGEKRKLHQTLRKEQCKSTIEYKKSLIKHWQISARVLFWDVCNVGVLFVRVTESDKLFSLVHLLWSDL